MKRTLFIILCVYGFVSGLASCSENEGAYPLPSDITDIKATPGPGSIELRWSIPSDSNLKYVEVKYIIPETGKSYRKQISIYADSLVADKLLESYGEIKFYLQAFNEGNTGGNVFTVSAQALPVPVPPEGPGAPDPKKAE